MAEARFIGRPRASYLRGGTELPRWPFLPRQIIFTDRADGTLWLLTHGEEPSGTLRVGITTMTATKANKAIAYGPWDGPHLAARGHTLRLFVRGGRLGYDFPEAVQGLTSSPVLTRQGVQHRVVEVRPGAAFRTLGDTIAFEEIRDG